MQRLPYLTEGGAAGHLRHLSDNLELTFGEIKDVIHSAAEGRLEKVSEKLDGMNLVFTYDVSEGRLKVARTGSDIKAGGMDAAGLAKKFFGRGNVEKAFNAAFTVLNQALQALSAKVQRQVFGPAGNRWFSLEIIYAPDPNTIVYDTNSVIFHGWPIFELHDDGSVGQSDDDTGVQVLSSRIAQMQKAVTMKNWRVRGPSLLSLKKLADGSIATRAIGEINRAMSHAGVSDDDTVFDYLRNLMRDDIAELDLPEDIADMAIERAVQAPGAPGIPQVKKATPPEKRDMVLEFLRQSDTLKRRMMLPIEMAIHNFAIEVLRGLQSTLIANSDAEVQRLRTQVNKAIGAIQHSGNQAAMDVLEKEMERLGSVSNIGAAMEGVVFFYKGQAYKFTGAFAPAHQILSLFKYGRKGIPKMDIGEARLRSAVQRLLNEGGHAFSNVGPISLDDFRTTWPHIKGDLQDAGCRNIHFIGTTGKKAVMGDIDLAAETDESRDELHQRLGDMFGHDAVTKVGPQIVSISYPIYDEDGVTDEHVQVDVMLGKTSYLTWSRFGTSPEPSHPHYSPVKGVVRNVLLNVINRFAAHNQFPGQQTDLDRVRYSIDFDKGLYKTVQTKRNKDPRRPPLKAWRTLKRTLVSDDPDVIASVMFGRGINAGDLHTFDDVVRALKRAPVLRQHSDQILSAFAQEMHQLVAKTPHILGPDPQASLNYIDQVVEENS